MTTEELVAHLASRAVPMRPLFSPAVRVAAWCVAAAASVAVGIAVFGARSDVGIISSEPPFVWPVATAVAVAVCAAASALVLAVPGRERSPVLRMAAAGLSALWGLLLAVAVARAGHGFAGAADWPVCFMRVLAIGFVPAMVMVAMLRRAAPLRLAWTSALAATAATATGALAIQFICPLDDRAHALLGHWGPIVAMAWLGAWAAERLLPRRASI